MEAVSFDGGNGPQVKIHLDARITLIVAAVGNLDVRKVTAKSIRPKSSEECLCGGMSTWTEPYSQPPLTWRSAWLANWFKYPTTPNELLLVETGVYDMLYRALRQAGVILRSHAGLTGYELVPRPLFVTMSVAPSETFKTNSLIWETNEVACWGFGRLKYVEGVTRVT